MLALRIKKAVRNGAHARRRRPAEDLADEDREAPPPAPPRHGRVAAERDDAHDPLRGPPGRGVHPRRTPTTSTRCARSSCATRRRTPRRSRASRPRTSAPTAREYATERHAAIFYTLGITEHACGVDNIWSLSNLVLMTGHLGYESTGLNALRGQNNVQGLNDSGANPMYLPGYQSVDDPEIRRKFSEAWGAEVPETPGYRLDQMMSGLHDGRVRALVLIGENPAQTEPNARHVEEGLGKLDFLISQDIFLHDMTREVRRRRASPRRASPRRTARSRTPSGASAACARRRRCRARRRPTSRSSSCWRRRSASHWPEYPDAESVWNELADLAPAWYGVRYDRLEENGMQWPVPEIGHPGTQFLHAPRPRAPPGAGSSSRSSTSGRSRSPTPSTRSSSPPGARSTTTTRRR